MKERTHSFEEKAQVATVMGLILIANALVLQLLSLAVDIIGKPH
jgi:hypothetical protein